MKKRLLFLVYIGILLIPFTGCQKDHLDDNAKLEFSSTEVTFDTVFTSIGSVTKNFRVYNPYGFDLKVDIDLAGGKFSPYSINVDGVAGTSFHDVEIPAHDSIFVHVKVNIDPTDQNSPFLVTDSVIFRHGNVIQDVDLVAFGQDANFIVADAGSGSLRYKIVAHEHEVVHWTNEKPYVIYGGYAAVDSLGTLIIDPGTTIYFHSNAGLWIYRYGNIQAVGTQDEPIVFRGDKLSSWFATDYAQWDRIWINESSIDNHFENVEITNSFIGLQVESLSEVLNGRTILRNCHIHNTYNSGVLARASQIDAENCIFSNNGGASLELHIGQYDFRHVTVANYFSQSTRKQSALELTDYYSDGYTSFIGNTVAAFSNSIIYGSYAFEDEVNIDSYGSSDVSVAASFRNCLIRHTQSLSCFENCIRNQDPMFVAKSGQDYHVKEGSPAIDAGLQSLGVQYDYEGTLRDNHPDIGAFEWAPR